MRATPALAVSLVLLCPSILIIHARDAGRGKKSWSAGFTFRPSSLRHPMTYLLGFVIALAIGLTGVGAGTLTTPLLILAVGLPARIAVGTSLIFGAVVKIITSPVYMARRQVDWHTLGIMLAGGVPGVLIGVFLLRGVDGKLITGVIGVTIVIVAIFNLFRPTTEHRRDRSNWLALIALPIGTEVGFSSAGAGAL